jgi:anti-anti-sigma factor
MVEKLVNVDKTTDVCIIRLSFNEINRDQRDELKSSLKSILENDGRNFIIDLSKVGFLSSLVIATLIFFSKEVNARGGKIRLFSTSSEPRAVLHLTKMDKIFRVYDGEKEAIESL